MSLAKNRGFVFQNSEIYGGLANTWDYGPLGIELKNNIKKVWWQAFIQESTFNVGIDSSILTNPKVLKASGHLENFNDPLIDCKECKIRFRADDLINSFLKKENIKIKFNVSAFDDLEKLIEKYKITCPKCKAFNYTKIRNFNLMFKTYQGVTEDKAHEIYLRPETAQGIFINFKNVQRALRLKIPFGIGQIGKSFRNEITPGNFIFRTREFEQMELEFFCHPSEDNKWFLYWKDFCSSWLRRLGLKEGNMRFYEHKSEELSHYSKATVDIEYNFPFGFGELLGIANRTDFDLKKHMESSKENLEYKDDITKETYVPYCIEPSVGVDRLLLAILIDAFEEQELEEETRNILHLHPILAPYKVAILPLSKKLSPNTKEIYHMLAKEFMVTYDETGSIGKRYRRQDEIGTPFCITYDFESSIDNKVTIRDRDSMEQQRIDIDEIVPYLKEKIVF